MAHTDPELELYRGLMETPDEFESGFDIKSVIGALFVGFIMMPGAIYLGLVVGRSMGPAAEWTTNREVLKLSLAGDDDTGQGGGKIRVKDQWQLSGDGKFLIVDRRIKSPDGSGTADGPGRLETEAVLGSAPADPAGGPGPATSPAAPR